MRHQKQSWLPQWGRRRFFKRAIPFGIIGALFNPFIPPVEAATRIPNVSGTPDPGTNAFVCIDDYAMYKNGDDWLPAVEKAQSLWQGGSGGFSLYFRPHTYHFSGPLHIVSGMSIIGSGGAGWHIEGTGPQGDFLGTQLVFDLAASQTSGIICETAQSAPSTEQGVGGDRSIIERVAIRAGGASHPDAHGIVMHARMKVRDVLIRGFGGDGVHIEANSNASPRTNANGWQLENCRIDNGGGHGVFVSGTDANAGCAVAVDCADNGGYGFYDSSDLGNTYIACQTDNNKGGPYASVGWVNGSCLYLNCYTEGDPPPASTILTRSYVIGGRMNCPGTPTPDGRVVTEHVWLSAGSLDAGVATFRNTVQALNDIKSDFKVVGALGSKDMPGVAFELHWQTGDTYRLHYSYQKDGWWEWVYSNLDGFTPLRLSVAGAEGGKMDAGNVWMENGYYIGGNRPFPSPRIHVNAAPAIPTNGTWNVGDQLLNANPVPPQSGQLPKENNYAGWICVQAGTPGSWKGFGLIEP